jgi:hypothetical protein
MKYFLDTEFHEYEIVDVNQTKRPTIELISLGIVAEDGREFYRISDQFSINPACANDWLMENVIKPLCVEIDPETEWDSRPHANVNIVYDVITQNRTKNDLVKSNYNIRQDLIEFIGNDLEPHFYAYYADYDWVVFCWLFGRMIDLPKGFPMYCRDLKQMLDEAYMWQEEKHEGKSRLESWLETAKSSPAYPQQANEHNALADAKWNYQLYKFLNGLPTTLIREPSIPCEAIKN